MELSHVAAVPKSFSAWLPQPPHTQRLRWVSVSHARSFSSASLWNLIRVIDLSSNPLRLGLFLCSCRLFFCSAHFFAPIWNVSKEVDCLTWFLTTSTITNECSFSQDKNPFMLTVKDQEGQVARGFSRRMLSMNMTHPRHQGKRYLDKTRKNIPDFLEMGRRRKCYRSGIIWCFEAFKDVILRWSLY